MDLLKRMVEGYDEQKALEAIALTVKDYWQDVIRAEQNRLVLQEDVAGIETHGETPLRCGLHRVSERIDSSL